MNIWFCWCVVYDNSAKMPYKQQTTDIFICCQIISHEVVSCFLYEPTIFFLQFVIKLQFAGIIITIFMVEPVSS